MKKHSARKLSCLMVFMQEDGFRLRSKTVELGYWRKHPNLHGYICQRRTKTTSLGRSKRTSVRSGGGLPRGPSSAWSSGFGGGGGLIGGAGTALALFEPVTVAVHLEDVRR